MAAASQSAYGPSDLLSRPDSDRWSEDQTIDLITDTPDLDFVIFNVAGKHGAFTFLQLKYLTFTLIGILLLWPWNCFLTALAYYADMFAALPGLTKIYLSTMMLILTVTSTLFNYYLLQLQTGVDYNHRINLGLSLTIGIFVIMAVSCVLPVFLELRDSILFAGLMVMVFLSAIATCFAQNGTMAIANVMGSIYANAVMVGQAVAGVLPSIALITLILLVDRPKNSKSATDEVANHLKNYGIFVYYITALLISFSLMTLLYWTNHYKVESAYQVLSNSVEEEAPHGVEDAWGSDEVVQANYVPFSQLWGKLKKIVSAIFLTFLVTLIFPVFALNVQSVQSDSENRFFDKSIFIPFAFLVWNLGDLLGRVLCGYLPRFVVQSPRTQIIYSILRLAFVPLFLTCNFHPQVTGALISSDMWYILLQFLFGLLNGQLCTSCFMIVGNYCDDDDEKEAAGGFTAVFLSIGLAFGSILSYLLVLAIT